jgi:hypothetical protein
MHSCCIGNGPVTGTILNAEYDQCVEDSAPIKRRQMFAKMGALSDYSKWAEEEGRYHRESFDLISPFIISTQYKADASPPSHFKLPPPPFSTAHYVARFLPFRSGLSARRTSGGCSGAVSRVPWVPLIVVLGKSVSFHSAHYRC